MLPWGSRRRRRSPFQGGPPCRKQAGEQSNLYLCHQSSLIWIQRFCHHQSAGPPPKKASSFRPLMVKTSRPPQTSLHKNLGKLISWNTTLVVGLCWEEFVEQRRGGGRFTSLEVVIHQVTAYSADISTGAPLLDWKRNVGQRGTFKPCSRKDHTGPLWSTPLFFARSLPPCWGKSSGSCYRTRLLGTCWACASALQELRRKENGRSGG